MGYEFSDTPLSASMLAKSFAEFGINRDQILRFLADKGYIADIRTVTDSGLSNGVQYMYSDTGSKWPVYDIRIQKLILDNIDVIRTYESTAICNTYTPRIPEEGTVVVPDVSITGFIKNNGLENSAVYKVLIELGERL